MLQLAVVLVGLAMPPIAAAADDQQWTILKPHGDRLGTIEGGVGDRLIIRSPSGERLGTIERGDQGEIEDHLEGRSERHKTFTIEKGIGGER